MSPAAPILVLERVRAKDSAGAAGRPRGHLFGLDAVFGAGVHAVLGAPEDGTLALIELLGGRVPPIVGRALVAGREPARDARLRMRLGILAAAPELPEAGSVANSVGLALRARGEPAGGAAAVLEAFNLSSLLARRSSSLSYSEARAVELALALTTPSPLLVALFEPFCDVALVSPSVVWQRLRDLGAAGVCVIVITSSPADARGLAERVHVLDRGVLARTEPGEGERLAGDQGPQLGAPARAELLVLLKEGGATRASSAEASEDACAAPRGSGGRAVAAALARSPAVLAVAWEEASDALQVSSIRIRAVDRDAAALALLDAVAAEDVGVLAISSPSPSLQDVRAITAASLSSSRPHRPFGAAAPVRTVAFAPLAAAAPVAPLPAAGGDEPRSEPAASPGSSLDASAPLGAPCDDGSPAAETPTAPSDAAGRTPEEEAQ